MENNTTRIIYTIGAVILVGGSIVGICKNWDNLQKLVDGFIKTKYVPM